MEREARRKKIASRETDRIALITGRVSNLDPNFPKSSSFSNNHHTQTHDHIPHAQHARSSSEPVFDDYPDQGGDDVFDALIKVSKTSKDQNTPPDKPLEYHLSTISAREIHFSIISSERSRVVCSFVIAVLAVLSHINLPHKVIKSKSLIAYRPLYAVLVSDVLIIGARLALYSQGKNEEREVKIKKEVMESWDGAVSLLERGLMVHQALRAVFIDCSLYLAIVICGLSLA